MRILIVSLFTSWETHFGAELEIAQRHLDAGDEVEVLGCDGAVQTCVANWQGGHSKCDRCRLRRGEGLKLLSKRVIEHRMGDYMPGGWSEIEREIEDQVNDADSAEAYTFDGMDLGAGALSSAIWRARDPGVESSKAKRRLVAYTKGATRSYLMMRAFLRARPGYNRAYVFNGRFGCTRGVFRACQAVPSMETWTHERGASVEKLSFYPGCLPHSRDHWRTNAISRWEAADPAEREKTGRAFFEERRRGQAVSWHSFTAEQRADLLPDGFDPSRTNVVIFNSSEDEFVGLGPEWKNPVYPMQSSGVSRVVVDMLKQAPEIRFYLRMHPNLRGVENRDVVALRALAAQGLPNFSLIEADSKISSYALLDVASHVLAFGSTMGVEASFWGKSSIMAGHAFYEGLDAVHEAPDHETVLRWLLAPPPPKDPLGALKYGYYARTHGSPFQYWRAEGFLSGTYRGHSLRAEPRSWLLRRLKVGWMDLGHALRGREKNAAA